MISPSTSRYAWTGRLVGAIAMLAFLAVVIAAREWLGTLSLLDTLADGILLVMPLSLFSWFLDLFGTQAKTLLLVGLAILMLLVGAGIGGRLASQPIRGQTLWQRAMAAAGVLFLVMVGLVWLVERESTAIDWQFIVSLGVGSALFGAVLALLLPVFIPALEAVPEAGDAGEGTDRRTLLGWGLAAVVTLTGIVLVGRDVRRVATRQVVGEGTAGQLPPAITPVEDFYIISKNFVDPQDDRGPDWSIQVDGLVDTPMTFFRADLEALGQQEFVSTQLCISNPVGGDLIGTAEWTGVPIAKVLDRVGVQSDAYKVIFEGNDGYTTAIPVERARDEHAHIVWLMNGEVLPNNHGGPVRTVVPGLYGMKTMKWLTKMTLTEDDYQGYWETRSWSDEAVVKTMSRIDVPGRNDVLDAGPVRVGGVAYAGDRGVSRVEVSTDDGETWTDAEIVEEPSPDDIAWVIWTHQWHATPGEYTLVVRAVETDGTVQTEDTSNTLPDGASGWHRIRVGVV